MQGLLELANVPYVGAGVLGSAVGMDKAVMKTLFAAAGLPIVPHLTVLRREWDERLGVDHAARRRSPALSDVRQARQPGLERRDLEGRIGRRTRDRDGAGVSVRPQGRRRSRGAEHPRDRVRRARQRRTRGVDPRRGRRDAPRRLLFATTRNTSIPRGRRCGSRPIFPPRRPTGSGASASRPSGRWSCRGWRASTSCSTGTRATST